MPHKRSIPYEDWILEVDSAESPCLRTSLEEAFVAMLNARDDGADDALRKFVEARSCRLPPRRGGRVPS